MDRLGTAGCVVDNSAIPGAASCDQLGAHAAEGERAQSDNASSGPRELICSTMFFVPENEIRHRYLRCRSCGFWGIRAETKAGLRGENIAEKSASGTQGPRMKRSVKLGETSSNFLSRGMGFVSSHGECYPMTELLPFECACTLSNRHKRLVIFVLNTQRFISDSLS